jgi:hypothetical protein
MIRNRLMNLEIMEIRTQRARIRSFAEQAYADEFVDGGNASGWGFQLEVIFNGSNASETAYEVLLDGDDAFIIP